MAHINISKANLLHNIKTISDKCGIDRLAAVLKDNAYGHGLMECARICQEAGVKYAVVRNISEAVQIRELFETILVLSDAQTPKYQNIHITINSIGDLHKVNAGTKIHLKIDSGMHRNGISHDEIGDALDLIVSKKLSLAGIMTHHRSADELSSEYFWQEKNFLLAVKIVEDFCVKNTLPKPMVHMHNSAGVFRKSSFDGFDLLRVGIALYGYMDLPSAFETARLKPVMSLYTDKISSRKSTKSFCIGYGGAGKISEEKTTSVYDIGYADGFFRLNETKNYTLPNGSKIIGRVSMDNMVIDSEDECICVFDDARELARINSTITYEVLVKLSSQIPRIIT